MDDFDAMEHLDSMKLNHKPTNELYEAVIQATKILITFACGIGACVALYFLCWVWS